MAKKKKKKATKKKKTVKKKKSVKKKKKAVKKKKVTKKKPKKKAKKKAAKKKPKKKAKKKVTKKKKKRKANPAFLKVMTASPVLAKVVGKTKISRPQAIKSFWAYAKKKNLQDSKDRRNINLDAHLKPLFGGKKQVSMFEVAKVISKNLKG